MLTTAIPSVFFPEDAQHYTPEDLEFMRRAFRRACDEHPVETATEVQRDTLAKAIFSRYLRGLSERDLVTAALWTLH